MYKLKKIVAVITPPLIASFALIAQPAAASAFGVSNLVTDDQTANHAQVTDANLVNGWGISYSPSGAFWLSANGTGTSTLYSVNGNTDHTAIVPLVVSIPGDGSVTGQVFNPGTGFNGDRFIFASEDGTISGWRGAIGTHAETLFAATGNDVYKGLAELTTATDSFLYAANFKTGNIDVFQGSTNSAITTSGHFVDPNLPSGFAPFNVQALAGNLFVSYAETTPNSKDETAGAGLGFVDEYDANGKLIARIASAGTLNAPWGLAIAPSTFKEFAGDLLVGNFGDGTINAYNLAKQQYDGQLTDEHGNPLVIDGLWGLATGNGGGAGSKDKLYFAAGPNGEANGLFGVITPVPEPASLMMFGYGLLGLAWQIKRKK